MKRLEIRPGFVLLNCFLFYLDPGGLLLPFLTLSILHELGHIAALSCFGVPIQRIRLGGFGSILETELMTPAAEAVCALAGPAVNIGCFFALRTGAPRAALLSLMLGSYNLLPVYPLDGGRALRAGLSFLPHGAARSAEIAVSSLCIGSVGLCCLRLGLRFGIIPLGIFALLLGHLCYERNSSCDFRAVRI